MNRLARLLLVLSVATGSIAASTEAAAVTYCDARYNTRSAKQVCNHIDHVNNGVHHLTG